MPEYKLEIKMSIEQDDYPGLSFTTFKVYRTDKNLEIDKDTYNMLLSRNLIEKRDTISDRIAINKEEIEKIEKESSKPRLFADLINEKSLKPNVAFTVYNINGATLNDYTKDLKDLDNVILFPANAWFSDESLENLKNIWINNILEFEKGNIVNLVKE